MSSLPPTFLTSDSYRWLLWLRPARRNTAGLVLVGGWGGGWKGILNCSFEGWLCKRSPGLRTRATFLSFGAGPGGRCSRTSCQRSGQTWWDGAKRSPSVSFSRSVSALKSPWCIFYFWVLTFCGAVILEKAPMGWFSDTQRSAFWFTCFLWFLFVVCVVCFSRSFSLLFVFALDFPFRLDFFVPSRSAWYQPLGSS